MEKRPIGALEVSVIGPGCNDFGRRLDAAGTARVVGAALDGWALSERERAEVDRLAGGGADA